MLSRLLENAVDYVYELENINLPTDPRRKIQKMLCFKTPYFDFCRFLLSHGATLSPDYQKQLFLLAEKERVSSEQLVLFVEHGAFDSNARPYYFTV